MEYSLNVNQLALRKWHGKIDGDDALIIAMVRSLHPDNEAIRSRMHGGLFQLTNEFFHLMIPMLTFKDDRLGDRLKHLQDIGLLDLELHTEKVTSRRMRFGRLSRLYWAEEERAQKHADQMKAESQSGEKAGPEKRPGRSKDFSPPEKKPDDHLRKDDQRAGAAPSGGADAALQQDRLATPEEVAALKAELPWERKRLEKRNEQLREMHRVTGERDPFDEDREQRPA